MKSKLKNRKDLRKKQKEREKELLDTCPEKIIGDSDASRKRRKKILKNTKNRKMPRKQDFSNTLLVHYQGMQGKERKLIEEDLR